MTIARETVGTTACRVLGAFINPDLGKQRLEESFDFDTIHP